jgi:putative phage-type endonuclease
LVARQKGITATDLPKILGLSMHGNALDVYIDKRAAVVDVSPGEAAHWGHLLEEPVAREWSARTGRRVRRIGMLRHADHPHHLANLDRLVVGRNELLEVKTRAAFVRERWADGIPDDVMAQVQWGLHVSGLAVAHVAALIGGQKLETYQVERNPDIIDLLTAEADRVWTAVLAGTPPEVNPAHMTAAALERLYPERSGATAVDPAVAAALLRDYREAAATATAADKTKTQLRNQLVALLGDADTATLGECGPIAYTYRAQPRRRVDVDRLLAVIPEAAGLIETTNTRTLRIPKETTA